MTQDEIIQLALHGEVLLDSWPLVRAVRDVNTGYLLAFVYEDRDGSRARLFAAAPKLLEAAKSALNFVEPRELSLAGRRRVFDQLAAAIEEAEGRAQ